MNRTRSSIAIGSLALLVGCATAQNARVFNLATQTVLAVPVDVTPLENGAYAVRLDSDLIARRESINCPHDRNDPTYHERCTSEELARREQEQAQWRSYAATGQLVRIEGFLVMSGRYYIEGFAGARKVTSLVD